MINLGAQEDHGDFYFLLLHARYVMTRGDLIVLSPVFHCYICSGPPMKYIAFVAEELFLMYCKMCFKKIRIHMSRHIYVHNEIIYLLWKLMTSLSLDVRMHCVNMELFNYISI